MSDDGRLPGEQEVVKKEFRETHKGFGRQNLKGRVKILWQMLKPGSQWVYITMRKKDESNVEMEVMCNIRESMRPMYVLGCTPERLFGVKPEDLAEFRAFVRARLGKQLWAKLQEEGGEDE